MCQNTHSIEMKIISPLGDLGTHYTSNRNCCLFATLDEICHGSLQRVQNTGLGAASPRSTLLEAVML